MKRNLFLLMLLAVVVWACPSFADLATVDISPGDSDIYEINNATPGTSKTFLGTRLRGLLQEGTSTQAACTTSLNACNQVSITPTTRTVLKTTGSLYNESSSLQNGYPGQLRTYVLVTDGGKDLRVTPVTKTGFTNIQLNDAGDSVTLVYTDDTTGWVVEGNNGAVIN